MFGTRHLVIVIGVLATATTLGLGLTSVDVTSIANAQVETPAVSAAETFKGDIVLGDPKAPVTVIEYASMTCPHCANFHLKELPELKKKYIDTGKVKLIFREFPLDALALRASMLARCGGEAKVHSFIDVLFGQQMNWASSKDPLAALSRIARMGGMSQQTFDACMADEALMKQIVQSRQDGADQFKINSTPGFIIDGKTYSAEELADEKFGELIDSLLPGA